jgi:hypothetical protein
MAMRRSGAVATMAALAAMAVAATGCGTSRTPLGASTTTTPPTTAPNPGGTDIPATSAPTTAPTTAPTSAPGTAPAGGAAAAKAALSAAYAKTVAAGTARVALREHLTVQGRTILINGGGAFGFSPSRGTLDIRTSVPGEAVVVIAERIIGPTVYLQLPAQERAALGGKKWVEVKGLTSVTSNNESPTETLSLLEGEASDVHRVGTATIGGVATTEYRGNVRLSSAAAHLSPALRTYFKMFTSTLGISALPVSVWVDGSGRARQVTVGFTIPSTATGAAAGAKIQLAVEFSDYGVPVQVSAPPASEVKQESTSSLLPRS